MLDNVFYNVYTKIMSNTKQLLKISQVEKILQVSRTTVYEFINDKENPLPVIYLSNRSPRIERHKLQLWINKQTKLTKNEK